MSGRYKNTLFCLNKSTRQLPVASLPLSGHCAPWCFYLCSCGIVRKNNDNATLPDRGNVLLNLNDSEGIRAHSDKETDNN